jgi:hypothetical protein
MVWSSLRDELDRWGAAGLRAAFWWRDDDATDVTVALERLLGLVDGSSASLTLAVIPATASTRLAEWLGNLSGVHVVQHGFSHRNHGDHGAKKIELAPQRPRDAVSTQLKEGLHRLRSLFEQRALPVMVPPWNRIPPALVGELPELGYQGLSTFGARRQAKPFPALQQANTHVDPIDWRGSRGFVGERVALESVVSHLRSRRLNVADRSEPTGLLTHHLQHDEATWQFCERLLTETSTHPAARWMSATEVFDIAVAGESQGGRVSDARST